MTTVILSSVGAVVANVFFTIVSYSSEIRASPMAYPLAVFSGGLAAASWVALIRKLSLEQQFVTNLIWDVGVTLLCVILPLIVFHVKIDLKTGVGAGVAVLGLIIAKW